MLQLGQAFRNLSPGRRTAGLAAALFLASFLLVSIYLAYVQKTAFDGFPTNGAFQLFNPLRRLAADQVPWRDFPIFHGTGTVYAHYPLFALLGGDLFASELSRYLMPDLLFVAGHLLIFWVLSRQMRTALVLTSATALVALVYRATRTALIPGNSSIGVRMAVPFLLGGFLILSREWMRDEAPPRRQAAYALIAGLICGLAIFVSTEQGMAAFGAFALTHLLFAPARWRTRIWTLAAAVASAGATTVLLFFAVAGPAALEGLRYAFVTVPSEQFWYFGSPPNPFLVVPLLGGWTPFHGQLALPLGWGNEPVIALTLVAGIVLLAVLIRLRRRLSHADGLIYLLMYGCLSSVSLLGILAIHYTSPVGRAVIISLVWLGYRAARRTAFWQRFGYQIAGWLCLALALAFLNFTFQGVKAQARTATGPVMAGVQMSLPWRIHVRQVMERLELAGSHGLWSTYSSLVETELGMFHPHTDYIIHALGPEARRSYAERFRAEAPRFVRTMPVDWAFEPWLMYNHWDFYEPLLTRYGVAEVHRFGVLWERQDREPRKAPWAEAPVDGSGAIVLPAVSQPELLAVELSYDVRDPWGWIPVLGQLTRHMLVQPGGPSLPVTLPPGQKTFSFPVLARPGAAPRLELRTVSWVPGPALTVTGVRFRPLDLPPENTAYLNAWMSLPRAKK